tara:strand:- start:87681 stop:88061 length:381 start_codon:yes stop_codon:yes gene_type:complete
MKNTKQANINTTLKKLFKHWLEITRPFHKLTSQQQDILALFLYYHYKLKQKITNEKILWDSVFDYDIRMKVKKELDMKDGVLNNNLTLFRKKKILNYNMITPMYIPELEKDSDNFKVIFNFNIINE